MRAVVATAEIVGFSAFAHQQAGGALPDPGQLTLLGALILPATLLALAGRLRARTVLPWVAVLQGVLHEAFSRLAPAGHPPVHDPAHAVGMPVEHGSAMLAAHLATVVVTVLVLLHQQQALHVVARHLLLGRPGPVAAPAPSAPPRMPETHVLPPADRPLLAVAPRRGPPQELLATP